MKYLKYIFIAVFILLIIAAIRYFWGGKQTSAKWGQQPKTVVATLLVREKQWQSDLQSIGNVKASRSILIRSEVPGIVTQINFQPGHRVEKDEILVKLRADQIEAALNKARVTLQDDFKNYTRRKKLLPQHYISDADLDHLQALVEKDRADINQQQALLEQHRISAPFSGVVGIGQVEEGQYITAGQAIVNVEALDEVYVDFSIAEKWLNRIKMGGTVQIHSYAYPNEKFTGTIIATSHAIDINSRSLAVRARLPNPHHKLLSGMAVNVFVQDASENKIIVPQSALAYTPEGVGVYEVDVKNIAHWRTVKVGERQGNEVVVLSGLKPGRTIVIAGQLKLHDNMPVAVNNQDLLIE